MFFEGNRIDAMRQMILADNEVDRRKALKNFFLIKEEIFRVFLRLLKVVLPRFAFGSTLHEFLPHDQAAQLTCKEA